MFKKMISKVEKFVKVPPKEGYIKNSSILVTGLMIIGMILYPFTKGYGTITALAAASNCYGWAKVAYKTG